MYESIEGAPLNERAVIERKPGNRSPTYRYRWIEAGELHWHGAAPGHTMVHLAIQQADANGVEVAWLEHVSEDEYATGAKRE